LLAPNTADEHRSGRGGAIAPVMDRHRLPGPTSTNISLPGTWTCRRGGSSCPAHRRVKLTELAVAVTSGCTCRYSRHTRRSVTEGGEVRPVPATVGKGRAGSTTGASSLEARATARSTRDSVRVSGRGARLNPRLGRGWEIIPHRADCQSATAGNLADRQTVLVPAVGATSWICHG